MDLGGQIDFSYSCLRHLVEGLCSGSHHLVSQLELADLPGGLDRLQLVDPVSGVLDHREYRRQLGPNAVIGQTLRGHLVGAVVVHLKMSPDLLDSLPRPLAPEPLDDSLVGVHLAAPLAPVEAVDAVGPALLGHEGFPPPGGHQADPAVPVHQDGDVGARRQHAGGHHDIVRIEQQQGVQPPVGQGLPNPVQSFLVGRGHRVQLFRVGVFRAGIRHPSVGIWPEPLP